MENNWFNYFLLDSPQDRADIVHFTHDDYGQILVIDNGVYRILNFDSPFEQSCMSVDHPYQLAHKYTRMMILVLSYIQPRHITLLGLGGGSLLRTLHHILPECYFDVVELRPKVVEVAEEYFQIPSDDRVRIIINDGLLETSKSKSQSSDIIFADMYDAYSMVHEQIQNEFLLNCSRILTDQGFLVINLHRLPDEASTLFQQIKTYFPTVMMTSNSGNIILYASKCRQQEIILNNQYIEEIELTLGQQLTHLLPNVKPINFKLYADIDY